MTAYLGRLKRALTGSASTPLVLLCNFEVEACWAEHHVGLPALPAGNASPVVGAMEELGVLLGGPDDFLVVKRPVDPAYLSYLEAAGFAPPTVLTPENVAAGRSTTADVLDSPGLLRTLAELGGRGALLAPMGTSEYEQKLAAAAGIPLAGPDAATCEHVNSKIYSRRATEELGLRPVPGTCCESVADLDRALTHYRDLAATVVVKDAYGVSGKGLVVLDSAARIDRLRTMVTRRARRTGDDRLAVVVEQWLPKRFDLNYQLTVDRAGEVTLDFVKRALTRDGVHQGHLDPPALTDTHRGELDAAAAAVGQHLHADGFTGVAGVDALLGADGTLYPVLEINARFNMSTYQGGVIERRRLPGGTALARHYPLTLPAPIGFAAVHDALRPHLASGAVVITCFATVNAAPFDGRLYLMLFAPDLPRIEQLDAAVAAALAPLSTVREMP